MSRFVVPLLIVLFQIGAATSAQPRGNKQATTPHVSVQYQGIQADYAEAIAELTEAAWQVYDQEFAFDLPDTVIVSVECDKANSLRLWNDGNDRIYLSLKTQAQLRKPATSGVFNVYGFCHELGHIAMYRTLKERPWLSGSAAEGWAHFCGSFVIDQVYAAHGDALWPDAYDYRADGFERLDAQLASAKPSDVPLAAGHWRELTELVGNKKLRAVFQAWNDADVDPANPADALRRALVSAGSDAASAADLEAWFDKFAAQSLVEIERSKKAAETIDAKLLSGNPLTLKYDDGTSDSKKSIAGGGHAVFFDAPPGDWYVTAVGLYGSRYGQLRAPREDFTVALCDEELKPISTWKKPYGTFERGEPEWKRITLPPTRVPSRFAICFDFKPMATKGVFVNVDDSTSGHSVVGLPGRDFKEFDTGDWMIRIDLDSPKVANALNE